MTVLSFKFHKNWLTDYRDVRGQNLSHCITLANDLYSFVPLYSRDTINITNNECENM